MIVETIIDYHELSWPFERALMKAIGRLNHQAEMIYACRNFTRGMLKLNSRYALYVFGMQHVLGQNPRVEEQFE